MKKILPAFTRFYGWLLRLYPRAFREEFGEEMLLDFADMLESANDGFFSLFHTITRELRDFPFSLLSAHLKEVHVSTMFCSNLARSTLRGAFAFGLAFATLWTTFGLIFDVMEDQGWSFLLRIANSRGWHLTYDTTAQAVLYFSCLILGALLAGVLLALCFHEPRRIRRYVLASLLGWVGPLIFLRIAGIFLNGYTSTLINSIFSQSGTIVIGLGFGVLFSMILQDRKKTPGLLIVGVTGYYLARSVAMLLLPLAPDSSAGQFNWSEIAFVAIVFGMEGAMIGALLGAVSGWSKRKATLIGVI